MTSMQEISYNNVEIAQKIKNINSAIIFVILIEAHKIPYGQWICFQITYKAYIFNSDPLPETWKF